MELRKKIKNRCSKIRKDNALKMTQAERKFKEFLDNNHIKYIFQYPIYSRTSFILVDFCVGSIAIEIDGTSHVGRRKTWQSYNKWRERLIKKQGLELIRFWNEEILDNSDKFRNFKHKLLSDV